MTQDTPTLRQLYKMAALSGLARRFDAFGEVARDRKDALHLAKQAGLLADAAVREDAIHDNG